MASNNSNVGSGSDNFGGDVVANRNGSGSVSSSIPNENVAPYGIMLQNWIKGEK